MASIPIADVINTERLPVDAQDIVSRVRLVVAGSPGGTREAARRVTVTRDIPSGPYVTEEYFPVPVVYEHTNAAHASLGCTRSLALPEGTNPFLEPTHASIPEPSSIMAFTNPGSPSAIRDGDPLTYAEASVGVEQALITFAAAGPVPSTNWCGYKLRYAWVSEGSSLGAEHLRRVRTNYSRMDPVSTGAQRLQALREYTLSATGSLDTQSDEYAITMQDARALPLNRGGEDPAAITSVNFSVFSFSTATVRVFEFYPLVLNTALLEEIAKANVRLPAMNPTRVTVRGYVPPDREHTVTGWPGGDYTGTVAQHQYELDRTVIDFEQAGAPVGLPAEAIEAARERTAATQAIVRSSSYSLTMGERQ